MALQATTRIQSRRLPSWEACLLTREPSTIQLPKSLHTTQKGIHTRYGSRSYLSMEAMPSQLVSWILSAQSFSQFYPTPTHLLPGGKFVPGTTGAEGETQNNFYSSVPQSTPNRAYFGRLDYDINAKHRLTMTDMDNDTPVRYPSSVTFCPVGCQGGDVETTNSQITDVWTVSPNTVNEARMGFMYQGNFFTDLSLGANYTEQSRMAVRQSQYDSLSPVHKYWSLLQHWPIFQRGL